MRLLLPFNRRLAADITLPVRTLDIDPQLLYEALRYYHQHPPSPGRARDKDGAHSPRAVRLDTPSQPVYDAFLTGRLIGLPALSRTVSHQTMKRVKG